MHLNKLTVRILRTLLIASANTTAGADHRVCRLAEDQARPTSRHDHGVSGKRLELERLQIHRHQAATNLMIVEHEGKHLPVLELAHFSVDFKTTDLFIESVE